ncbi:hypothetical protein ACT7DB_00785 [Bacillus cereus]
MVKVRNEIEDEIKEITGLKSYLKDKDAEDGEELNSKATRFQKRNRTEWKLEKKINYRKW